MNKNIVDQAAEIFDSPEKWRAFYDMQQASPQIINHWLTIGAKALREEFGKNPGKWKCAIWGNPWDTKWYLSALGEESISIGIGWPSFELHLYDGRNNEETWQNSADLLEGQEFRQLLSQIGSRCFRPSWQKEKLLLADLQFDPLETGAESGFRPQLIAWHAGQNTGYFVEKTLGWVRRIMEDEETIRLIGELNERSSPIGT